MRTRRKQGWPTRRRAWVWRRPQNPIPPAGHPLETELSNGRRNFEELSRILRGDLMKQETRMRKPASLEKRIAFGLWRLSTGNSYRLC